MYSVHVIPVLFTIYERTNERLNDVMKTSVDQTGRTLCGSGGADRRRLPVLYHLVILYAVVVALFVLAVVKHISTDTRIVNLQDHVTSLQSGRRDGCQWQPMTSSSRRQQVSVAAAVDSDGKSGIRRNRRQVSHNASNSTDDIPVS